MRCDLVQKRSHAQRPSKTVQCLGIRSNNAVTAARIFRVMPIRARHCCSTLHPLQTQPSTHAMHDFQLAVAWNTSRLAQTMPPPSRERSTILAYPSLCARPSSSHHCQTQLQPSPKSRETAYPTFHCSYTTAPFRSIARRVVHLSGSSAETECSDDPAEAAVPTVDGGTCVCTCSASSSP